MRPPTQLPVLCLRWAKRPPRPFVAQAAFLSYILLLALEPTCEILSCERGVPSYIVELPLEFVTLEKCLQVQAGGQRDQSFTCRLLLCSFCLNFCSLSKKEEQGKKRRASSKKDSAGWFRADLALR